MQRRFAIACCVVWLSSVACHVGPDVRSLRPANTPNGSDVDVSVTVASQRSEYVGELFEVREQGVVLLTYRRRLVFVDWRVMRRIKVASVLTVETLPPAPDQVERMRLVSRHPYGLTPDQLSQLVAEFGEIENVVPR